MKNQVQNKFIDSLGGTSKVAKALGVEINVVSNWRVRGVPLYGRVGMLEMALADGVPIPPQFEPQVVRIAAAMCAKSFMEKHGG